MPAIKHIFILWSAFWVGSLALAQDPAGTGAPVTQSESRQAARTLLLKMAEELAGAKKFQVDMRVGYDALQANGQKIEFGEQRRLSLERPSLVLNETRNSDGTGESIVFDGEWISIIDNSANVYSRAPQPGDIDATVTYFLQGLQMRLPLAMMMMSRFPQELEQRMTDIDYVEETDILGEPTIHVAGRTRDVDFQAWITTGRQALPLRIILTYREQPAQPQFWANFSNWNFNPSFAQKAFTFDPPQGAREIPLVASFRAAPVTEVGAPGTAPSTAGEQQ